MEKQSLAIKVNNLSVYKKFFLSKMPCENITNGKFTYEFLKNFFQTTTQTRIYFNKSHNGIIKNRTILKLMRENNITYKALDYYDWGRQAIEYTGNGKDLSIFSASF